MRFVIDAQLPPARAGWIAARGHDAAHVEQLGLLDASDQAIWDVALAENAIVVTKDRDFVEWATTRRPAPQVVWLRLGNVTNRSLTTSLDTRWDAVVAELTSGTRVVELSRR